MKVARITLSDRASAGVYEDRSGPELERVFGELAPGPAEWVRALIPDEQRPLEELLRRLCDEDRCQLILTTGGTGPSLRDVTPEATRTVLDREAPGIAEAIRADARTRTPHALLARGTAGLRGKTLVVNLPGSPGGCRDGFAVIQPALRHGLELAAGDTATPHRQT